MALFKVFRGQRNDLDSVTKVDGHAYFCTDDGSFWIDYLDGTTIKRKQVNESELASLNDKFDDYVTLDTDQTINGYKKFNGNVGITHENGVYTANYGYHGIIQDKGDDGSISYLFPNKPGTFALLSDIPTNYVTTDTFQTISKMKIFTGDMDFTDTGYEAPYRVNGVMIGSSIYIGNGLDNYLSASTSGIEAISTVGNGAFILNSSGLTFNSMYGEVSLNYSHNNNLKNPKNILTIRGDELSLLSDKISYETNNGYLTIGATTGIDLLTDTNNGSFFRIYNTTAMLRLADSNGNWSAVNFSKAGLPTIEINKANGDRTSETIATREWVKQQIEWLIVN